VSHRSQFARNEAETRDVDVVDVVDVWPESR